jgi:amino acid transporter
MSIDGLLPRSFAKVHKQYGTPYVALIVLCSAAFVVSVFGGLSALINSSVFLLAFVYLATCLSTVRLEKKNAQAASKLRWKIAIPVLGAAFSFALMVLVDPVEIVISLIVLAVGVWVYAYFSPKREMAEAKAKFLSEEAVLRRAAMESTTFLAHPIYHLKRWTDRRRRIKPALIVTSPEDPAKEQQI